MIRCSRAASRLAVIKHCSHLLFESGSRCPPPGHWEQPVTERSPQVWFPQQVSINTFVIWNWVLYTSQLCKRFEDTCKSLWRQILSKWPESSLCVCVCVCRWGWCGGFSGSEDRHGQLVALHAHRVFIIHRKPGSIPHRVTHGPRYMVRLTDTQQLQPVYLLLHSDMNRKDSVNRYIIHTWYLFFPQSQDDTNFTSCPLVAKAAGLDTMQIFQNMNKYVAH